MTKHTIAALILCAGAAIGLTTPARAGDIFVTPTFDASNQAPLNSPGDTTDYEGIAYDAGAAPYDIAIGTFNFTIPTGETVLGASISGTFGDVNYLTSALADLFVLNGTIGVGECDINADPDCAFGTPDFSLVPWSYTFSSTDLQNLGTDLTAGSIDFTAVQNSDGATVIGSPTLDIEVTPEPASLFTLAGGLLAFAAFRRRK